MGGNSESKLGVPDVKENIRKHGMGEGLYNAMLEAKDKWQREKISIAVVGPSRVGKSSHINAHLGEKKAQVSPSRQCTMTCTHYSHPQNANISLWDVPGFNTKDFKLRENYLKQINFDRYDFFLILTQDIFTDDIGWLTEQIRKKGKFYYLVRTKIDHAVEDAEDDNSKEKIKDDIRKTLHEDLNQYLKPGTFKVYLVNNKNKNEHDFPELRRNLCRDSFKEFRFESLLITVGAYDGQLLETKYEMLGNRIWKVSLGSAAGGTVPLPGVSAAVDVGIIIGEIIHYYKAFGLDKSSIASLERLVGKKPGEVEDAFIRALKTSKYQTLYMIREQLPEGSLEMNSEQATALIAKISTVILPHIAAIAASELVENAAKYLIPVIGMVVGAGMSYATTACTLKDFLDQMMEMAGIVNNLAFDKPQNSIAAD